MGRHGHAPAWPSGSPRAVSVTEAVSSCPAGPQTACLPRGGVPKSASAAQSWGPISPTGGYPVTHHTAPSLPLGAYPVTHHTAQFSVGLSANLPFSQEKAELSPVIQRRRGPQLKPTLPPRCGQA